MEQGRIGVATIYLGGGVCGALGASLLQPSLYLVGASAGVYALLTSHLAHLYLVSGRAAPPAALWGRENSAAVRQRPVFAENPRVRTFRRAYIYPRYIAVTREKAIQKKLLRCVRTHAGMFPLEIFARESYSAAANKRDSRLANARLTLACSCAKTPPEIPPALITLHRPAARLGSKFSHSFREREKVDIHRAVAFKRAFSELRLPVFWKFDRSCLGLLATPRRTN